MSEFIKFLPDGARWIPFILIFAALPYIYCTLAIDVHKEYAEVVQSSTEPYPDSKMIELSDAVHLFELDWWIIAAISVMFLGILSLSDLALKSSQLDKQCRVVTAQPIKESSVKLILGTFETQSVMLELKQQDRSECGEVKNALFVYVTAIGLLILYRIFWARLSAARRLREFYNYNLKVNGERA